MNGIHPIRAYRRAQTPPLTLSQLAAVFGVDKSTVKRWEEGHVPAERVPSISEHTGIPRFELRPDLFPPAALEPGEAPE